MPELSELRVKPVPGVTVPPRLLVAMIPSRKAPSWKVIGIEVEMDVPRPEPVAFVTPVVLTPEIS